MNIITHLAASVLAFDNTFTFFLKFVDFAFFVMYNYKNAERSPYEKMYALPSGMRG